MARAKPLGKAAADRFDHLPPAMVERAKVKVAWRLPRQADAMTIGRTIYVRSGHQHSQGLLAHVRQWQCHGTFGFLRRYLWAYARNLAALRDHMAAYRAIPFEAEAREEAAAWKARHR